MRADVFAPLHLSPGQSSFFALEFDGVPTAEAYRGRGEVKRKSRAGSILRTHVSCIPTRAVSAIGRPGDSFRALEKQLGGH